MIRLVLLKMVYGLGSIGEIVSVRSGYARNYLLPQGFAVVASKVALVRLSLQEEQVSKERASVAEEDADLYMKLDSIRGKVCIYVSSIMDGKFFGSVSVQNFIDAIKKLGIALEKKQVYFPGKKIKSVGEYEASVRVGKDRRIMIPFSVLSILSSEESVES